MVEIDEATYIETSQHELVDSGRQTTCCRARHTISAMVCPSCSVATNAGDKFCANCGSALEQRCGTCGTVLPEDARFCPSCGTSLTDSQVGNYGDQSGEERKVVSVLFADLVGFTASSDGADPEDVSRRVQPFHTTLREVGGAYRLDGRT